MLEGSLSTIVGGDALRPNQEEQVRVGGGGGIEAVSFGSQLSGTLLNRGHDFPIVD